MRLLSHVVSNYERSLFFAVFFISMFIHSLFATVFLLSLTSLDPGAPVNQHCGSVPTYMALRHSQYEYWPEFMEMCVCRKCLQVTKHYVILGILHKLHVRSSCLLILQY